MKKLTPVLSANSNNTLIVTSDFVFRWNDLVSIEKENDDSYNLLLAYTSKKINKATYDEIIDFINLLS